MKSKMKKLVALFVCVCMLMTGTVYAQENANAENPGNATKSTGEVAINETNFPDANFRAYVSSEFDTSKDGILSAGEMAAVTLIDVRGKSLSSLTGIEHFTALEQLVCDNNQLTSLDVSKNTELYTLYCSNNNLTTLDVSKNTALTNFWCDSNQLTTLDLSKNTELFSLGCEGNNLTTLDVSKNTKLSDLHCVMNNLTTLDVSKNTELENLYCAMNNLTTLDLSKNTALVYLDCSYNKQVSLDISKNIALEHLYCDNNKLTSLDVRRNEKLRHFVCSYNQLTSLDVSKNVNLGKKRDLGEEDFLPGLECDNNKLTSLDVSKNVELQWLNCSSNQLTSLDVSKNAKLEKLHCLHNKLTSLDVRNCTALTELDVRPLAKSKVQYTTEPDEFYYGPESETPTTNVSVNTNSAQVQAGTDGINEAAIYEKFNVDTENSDAEVIVEQTTPVPEKRKAITDYVNKIGGNVLQVYEVNMNLYVDDEYRATVTDDFGKLTLSFNVGSDYIGKKVSVYQLHGANEIIPYKNLTVDKNGMVTITVSKLSTFAVAEESGANSASPITGDMANMMPWFILLILSIAAIAVVARRRQRR